MGHVGRDCSTLRQCVYNKHIIFPVPGARLPDPTDVASIGMTAPDMPAPAAILGAVAARPGLMTRADLPLRGLAGRCKP